MLLSTLVKTLAVVTTVGGGAFTTYYLTSGSGTNSPSNKITHQSNPKLPCSKPFVMKTTTGITMWVDDEKEGREFLQQHYKNEGTVEPCVNPVEVR